MRMRFKSALGVILLLIIGLFGIGIGYLFYDEEPVNADIVVDGDITINYLSGKDFKLNGNGEVEFSVTNNDNSQKFYYIQLTDVYAKDVSYELKSSDNLEITNQLKSDIISNQVSINGNETQNYTIKFKTDNKKEYSGSIIVGVKNNEENTFMEVLLKNNEIKESAVTKFGDIATLDEGLIKSTDDLGTAYYFRGNVLNNYVSFADKVWRVVKINGDGSVKLILDGVIDNQSKYYEDTTDYLDTPQASVLDLWYKNNLQKYGDFIAYYKFCNDKVLEKDNTTFTAYYRIVTNKIPNYTCLGTLSNAKVGLLTADEVMYAGAGFTDNTSYFLYNSNVQKGYFTMTSASFNNGVYSPFSVTGSGALSASDTGVQVKDIRPVLNIIRNAKVMGSGTQEDPYTIITEN